MELPSPASAQATSPRLLHATHATLTPAFPSLLRRPGSHVCGASELPRRVLCLLELSTQVGPVSCAEGLDVRVPAGIVGADPWSGCCLRFGFLSLDEFLVPTSHVLASYTF